MVFKKTALKPSLQRIVDARYELTTRIADERLRSNTDQMLIKQLRVEKRQLKDMLAHLSLANRVKVTKEYVYNMADSVLELLRQFLKDELDTMLRGGKNDKNRIYVDCLNELNVVLAEQDKRTKLPSAKSEVESLADAA